MWLILSFLTAVFASAQDILSKRALRQVSPYVTAWSLEFFSVPFLLLLFLGEKPVALGPQFWPALAASTILLTVALVFFFKSIEMADLSLTVPMLSFTPLFLLITSPLIVHEFPAPLGIAGIVLIVTGCYVLFIHPGQESVWAPVKRLGRSRGSRYMLVVSVLYSIGGNIDKIGILNSSPLVWSVALNTAVAAALGIIMLRKVRNLRGQLFGAWPWLVMIGLGMALMMIAQMNALKLTIVPYVIAIKRTSIIMTAVWGLWFLKEKGVKERLIAVLLMVAGVFVISFSH